MRVLSFGVALSGAVVWATFLGACGSDDGISTFHAPSPWKLDAGGVAAPSGKLDAASGTTGSPLLVGVGSSDAGAWADSAVDAVDADGTLAVAVTQSAIDVTYGQATPTVTASASINGQPVAASFSIDRGQVGSINASTGVLVPTGIVGGVVTVTATFGAQQATVQITVRVQWVQDGGGDVETDAGDAGDAGADSGGYGGSGGVGGEGIGGPVGPTAATAFQGSPAADSSLSLLYPYDQTIWPQGILAPLLQWSTTESYDAVSIHLQENAFDYQGYFAKTATPFIHHPIPQPAWDALAASNQGEAVTVTLVFAAGGVAYGPITETWQIAQGSLTGTVYYNSYGTNLAHNYCCTLGGAKFGGATLGIKRGATDPVLIAGNDSECRVCHIVSANGSRLVTSRGESTSDLGSSSYALTGGLAETVMSPDDGRYNWGAIDPTGSFLLTNNAPVQGGGYSGTTQILGIGDGGIVPSTGIPDGLEVGSPVFSPDGMHVAFNLYAGSSPDGGTADGKSLAMMDYDPATGAFSNFQTIYTPPSGYTVWPSFLPASNAIVFELETVSNGRWGETRKCPGGSSCSNPGTQAQLWWVDVATKQAVPLSNLNGVGYLPMASEAGHADDTVFNYEPTVNPVPSGGYAWVVFTSRRLYGNIATIDPYWSDPRYFDLTASPTPKKLWVAAIDLNAPAGTDPSHPAFYLPAQELLAGNSRGYWVVDACAQNGSSCLTGDQCCGGYCSDSDGGLVCSDQPPACSTEYDKCTQTSDCCGAAEGMQCIGGRCALASPPPPPTVIR
jgi:hypothetical protein